MNKSLIVKIGGTVSALIFALGAFIPIASVELFGTKMSTAMTDSTDWILVVLTALLGIAAFWLSEDISVDICAATAGFIAYGKLNRFFDDKATTTTTAAPEPENVIDSAHPVEAYFMQNDNFASGAVEGAVPYIQLYSDGTFDFQCNKYSDVLTYKGTWEYMSSRWGFNFVLTVTDSNYGSASNEVKNTPITLSYFGDNESAEISYANDGHSGVYGMTTPNSTFEVIYFNYLA